MARPRRSPLALTHPENRGVLAYLEGGEGRRREPWAVPSSFDDPYLDCGCHPDVVERVWGALGQGLPRSCRALVYGTPALVHDVSGVVLATGLGTQYALRVPALRLEESTRAGLAKRHTYRTIAMTLELADFGPQWRFGAWHASEAAWLRESYDELAAVRR